MKWFLLIVLIYLLIQWFRKLDKRSFAWSQYQATPHIETLGELVRADDTFITYTKTLLALFLIGTIFVVLTS